MSLRSYLLYLSFALLILVLAGVLLWPFLQVDDALRNLILDQLNHSFSGTIDLKRAIPGFFTLKLYGLEVSDAGNLFSLKIREARVEFSPLKLIKYRLNVLSSISSVSLSYPEVAIRVLSEDSLDENSDQQQRLGWAFLDSVPDGLWISEAHFTSGVLHLLNSKGNAIWSLRNLDGELESPQPGVLKGHLRGGSEDGGEPNCKLKVLLDAQTRTLESVLKAGLGDIAIGSEFGLPESVNLFLDSLSADMRFWAKDTSNGLEGEITLLNLSLEGRERRIIQSDSLSLLFGGWKLLIPQARAVGLTAQWVLSGRIPDLRDPCWDFRIDGRSEECSDLASWLSGDVELVPSGEWTLQVQMSGEIRSPKLQFQGKLNRLKTKLDLFEELRFSGEFGDNLLELIQLRTNCSSGHVTCNGRLKLKAETSGYTGAFCWRGSIPGLPGSSEGTLNAEFSGAGGAHKLQGRWLSSDTSSAPVEIDAAFYSSHDRLIAGLKIPESASFAEIIVSELSTRPSYFFRFDEPIAILRKFYSWDGWDRLGNIYCTGELDGRPEEMLSKFDVYYGKGPSRFRFDGKIHANSSGEVTYLGALNFQQGIASALQGHISLSWKRNILTLEDLELDAAVYARGSVDLGSGEIGPSELIISKWDVSRGVQLISPDWAQRLGGILDGRVEIYGIASNPTAFVNLYASQGYFRQESNFWAVFSAELENKKLKVSECNIGRGVLSLLKFDGAAALDSQELGFHLISDRADVSDFLDLLGANPLRIRGHLNLDATLAGSFKHPALNLSVDIPSGHIYKVPFERLRAVVQMDSTTQGLLALKELHLIQSSDLQMKGWGLLPFGKAPLSLHLLMEGNVLRIPNLIEDDILLSDGRGKVLLEFGEANGHVHLKNAQMEIQNGIMRFPDVVDEIRSVKVKIHTEGNRVVIEELKGEVERQQFSISNFFSSESDSGGYEHLYFPGADIDLGVVTLETEGRGLFARIPTLMLGGVRGFFRMEGKEEDERFLFAGPIENPLIRGTVKASGTIITYPFPPSKKMPPRFVRRVLSVLESASWDLNVLPERDNRFVREIRGLEASPLLKGMSDLLTTVDINLNINPGISNLKVLGNMDSGNFRLLGSLVSTRGAIEYLDMKFNVDRFTLEFDEHDPLPWVEGRGQAIYIDSLGQTRNIYLTLYVIDPVTGERTLRGRWGDFVFIIEDDAGSSQEQILAAMGYSPEQITDKVTSIGGMIISDAVLRRWIRPIERELETLLDIDYIRLQPTFAQHLFEAQVLGTDPGPESEVDWSAYFLRQSQLSVGKYLSDDLFLTYTGLWESGINAQNERRFGFLHRWGIEYRIRRVSNNLILKFGYEYDSLEQLRDRDVTLRYSFTF